MRCAWHKVTTGQQAQDKVPGERELHEVMCGGQVLEGAQLGRAQPGCILLWGAAPAENLQRKCLPCTEMSLSDIRVGFPPPKIPFAVEKVLVAKTRISPGLLLASQPGSVEQTIPSLSPFA